MWIGFFWCLVALMGSGVLVVAAARELGRHDLRNAVKDSVRMNAEDRERNTTLILERLKKIEQRMIGLPDSTTANYFR